MSPGRRHSPGPGPHNRLGKGLWAAARFRLYGARICGGRVLSAPPGERFSHPGPLLPSSLSGLWVTWGSDGASGHKGARGVERFAGGGAAQGLWQDNGAQDCGQPGTTVSGRPPGPRPRRRDRPAPGTGGPPRPRTRGRDIGKEDSQNGGAATTMTSGAREARSDRTSSRASELSSGSEPGGTTGRAPPSLTRQPGSTMPERPGTAEEQPDRR